MDDLFGNAADRLFAQHYTPAVVRAVESGQPAQSAWQACHDSGFLDALVSEADGGAGLQLGDILPLFRAAGRQAVCAPLADTVLARAWLHAAGHAPPEGPIALAPFGLRTEGDSQSLTGAPWGSVAQWILAADAHGMHLMPASEASVTLTGGHGSLSADLAWQKGAGTVVSSAPPSMVDGGALPSLPELAALAYTGLMSGAMERILALTVDYASQRSQFGKPIGRFQAVQQQLSILAEQTWATRMAAQLAFQSKTWAPSPLLAAMGKARASLAAATVADIAHAVHGAIGITEEYDLQHYTRRLREWRRAAGAESYWMARIGQDALTPSNSVSALDYLRTTLSTTVN
ncbi:acyl-CoA dehydrogenase family protein [Achromobacter xylosoxidans]|uniref:acyl-CoA dehydrogenase family protein n=1 Tax=Alcaligenes xylosoxydans xylosoxydans TaxID=85698 RepID=UPI001F12D5B2|nr:acyl-CoA dehydrogenase family protein [Achromobacter xylosoxidans]